MITPIIFNPIENNPYFWWNGLEIPIQLKYLFEKVISHDKTIEELVEAVNKFNEEFEQEIKQEVVDTINAMYESGELQQLVDNALVEYLSRATSPRFTQPETNRLFRICRKAHEFLGVDLSTETPHFSYCQGGCMFVREGITYYVGCFVVGASDNRYYFGDDCDIRIYRKYSGGWYFVKNAIKNVFHGNDIAYDETKDRFYITPSIQWIANQGGGHTSRAMNTVYILDWDLNFADEEAVTFPQVNKLSNVCCINGDVFVCSDGRQPTIYKVVSFETPELAVEMSIDLNDSRYTELSKTFGLYGSGLCGNENFFFMGSSTPNAILRFNRVSKELDWIYGLTEFGNNHMFRYGEFENISVIDNVIYFGTSIQNHNSIHFLDYCNVFAFDYVNNSMLPNKAFTNQSNSDRLLLYVGNKNNDASIDANDFEISNPNGNQDNYFPTLNEAIMLANAQINFDKVEIVIETRNILEPVCFSTSKNLFIEGNAYHDVHKNDADINTRWVHIGAVFITGGCVSFQNIQIENHTYSGGNIGDSFLNNQILVRDGLFSFQQGRIFITGRTDDSVLWCTNSFINWFSMYINANENGQVSSNNSRLNNSSVNFHGVYSGENTNVIG